MEPADASGENCLPIEVARLELSRRFIAAVVEDHRSAYAVASVTVNRRHVGSVNTVMFKAFVKGPDTHRADSFGNKVADRIIHHSAGHTRLEAEAIGEIG